MSGLEPGTLKFRVAHSAATPHDPTVTSAWIRRVPRLVRPGNGQEQSRERKIYSPPQGNIVPPSEDMAGRAGRSDLDKGRALQDLTVRKVRNNFPARQHGASVLLGPMDD
ncbi:hypothetical protein Bbelb_166960 [Branchiostoma belcheri]|nr:hypothetical protein Bbelb_166960 [Branchiostoma belcheri]